jgi:ATP-dependent Clp protease protease subunit
MNEEHRSSRNMVPIDEEEEREERGPSDEAAAKLRQTRTIVLSGDIDKKVAERIIADLLIMENDNPDEPITIFIDSEGGDADAGFAIYDMIRFVKPAVKAVCTGIAASAATTVLLAADKNNRYALPSARVLIHQPSMALRGRATELEINASEMLRFRAKCNELIAKETGQPVERVEKDTLRDYWMSAQEAKEYGIIAKIVSNRSEL